jgi:hypothetical protein
MFTSTDSRISASNKAVLCSESFLLPMRLRSEGKASSDAFDALHRAFEEIKGFMAQLLKTAPGIALVGFDEAVAPRVSQVEVTVRGKLYRFDLTFALKCPIPKEQDFWARIRLISGVYDRLSELAAGFQEKKGIELVLEESRLDQQKEDPERVREFRK